MNLKAGSFFWTSGGRAPRIGNIHYKGTISTEVLIIGAGITGALLAEKAASLGKHCIVLDKRGAAQGSTLASTAILQYELDTMLVDLQEKIGEPRAALVYLASQEALRQIPEIVGDDQLAVSFRERPSLYLSSTEQDAPKFAQEFRARRSLGLDVNYFSSEDLRRRYSFTAPAALYANTAYVLNPVALTTTLLNRVISFGGEILDAGEVDSFWVRPGKVEAVTDRGTRFVAEQLIVAAGYESLKWIPEQVATLHSTYAVVSEPRPGFPGWPDQCVIWESARPYFYARTTPGGRAVFGGNDHRFRTPFLRDIWIPVERIRLAKKFQSMFPDFDLKVAHSWAGTFGETADSMPLFGEYPGIKRVFFALAYGGNGIVFAALGRNLLASWMKSERSELTDVFGFSRLRQSAGLQLAA